jgi:tetratricopeptide (TPR) repeat protein
MTRTQAMPQASDNTRRRRLFWLGLLSLPIAFFATCEGLARLAPARLVADDPNLNLLFVPEFFEPVAIAGEAHYRVAHGELYSERGVTFPARKPANGFRVFCVGGSASAGWPHPPGEDWCAQLEPSLAAALPHQQVEVINVSAHAYASYRVRLVFQQVMRLEPDLVLIWSGNNEFLERRTYLDRAPWLEQSLAIASRSAAFRLLRGLSAQLLTPQNSLAAQQRQDVLYEQWSKVQRVALDLRRDTRQLQQVIEHFRWGLEAMVEEASRAGVPVVLVTVPVNLRDWQPNVSLNELTGARAAAWEETYRRGRAALLDGNPGAAIAAFHEAIALEPRHAASFFYLGRAYEATGAMARSVTAYQRARDLDHNPFRAGSFLNAEIREVARHHNNAHVADVDGAFLSESAPRAPGFDLFLDYVHPTATGNQLAAETAFGVLQRADLLGPDARQVPFAARGPSQYDPEADEAVQRTLFWLFGLMHQYESITTKARFQLQERQASWRYLPHLHRVFSRYLEMEERGLRGRPMPAAEQARVQEQLDRFYREGYSALSDPADAPPP